MRILSVDDSTATRLFIKRATDLIGYELLEAGNGKEGLEVIERENGRIELVILDWHMPVMSGIEMLEALKTNDKYKHIPISMVTVEVERDEIQKAIDLGAANYLIKPFSKVNLIGKIMEGLGIEM